MFIKQSIIKNLKQQLVWIFWKFKSFVTCEQNLSKLAE